MGIGTAGSTTMLALAVPPIARLRGRGVEIEFHGGPVRGLRPAAVPPRARRPPPAAPRGPAGGSRAPPPWMPPRRRGILRMSVPRRDRRSGRSCSPASARSARCGASCSPPTSPSGTWRPAWPQRPGTCSPDPGSRPTWLTADQLLLFAALAPRESTSRATAITEHVWTGAGLAGLFLGAEIAVDAPIVAARGHGLPGIAADRPSRAAPGYAKGARMYPSVGRQPAPDDHTGSEGDEGPA